MDILETKMMKEIKIKYSRIIFTWNENFDIHKKNII
jgi:hypothetical protein